jgi:hypothetical protein
MNYTVGRADPAPRLEAAWNDRVWARAGTLEVGHFRPESSGHHPGTTARLLYDERGVCGIFRVQDRYVRCLRTGYHDPVWKDSCVEFFAQPKPDCGYFNFEFNCGGAFLCCYVTDPAREGDWFKEFVKVPPGLGRTIQVRSSLPRRIEPEITEPVTWTLSFFIPFPLFEHYVGRLGVGQGQVWRGNFFKCAEENSHPHWAAWSPVDEFNFHRPSCFGSLRFT